MKTSYKSILILWLISLCVFTLYSCEKTTGITVIGSPAIKIVIEGNLTNAIDSPQYVKLSYSLSAADTVVPLPVTDAIVTVIDASNNTYNFVQQAEGTYSIKSLKTNRGENYTMQVKVGDKVYTATSQMPKNDVQIDTMSISRVDIGNNSYRAVNTFFYDPANPNNQYRFIMTVNGVKSKTIFVMNNELVQGKYAYMILVPYDIVLKVGDVLSTEIQCIDKKNYNYWYTLSQQQSSAILALDNSSKSVNPISNFDNGALGYFSAHTSHSKKYLIYGAK